MQKWSVADIPPQGGKLAVITGPGGLGYETGLALARAGAEVILAGRSEERGGASVRAIRNAAANADVRFEKLDLASLASIKAFAERLTAQRERLDILINNAGVMALPARQTTEDGFERQFGTNHLGHFALTGRLLPLLVRADKPRVITLSSVAAKRGKMNFADLQGARGYNAWRVYSQSKLANVLFALELQRRADIGRWKLSSIPVHPGVSKTELIAKGPGAKSGMSLLVAMIGQSAAAGALPSLFAATASEAIGGEYYGPDGLLELQGAPKIVPLPRGGHDDSAAVQLWRESEKLTGVTFQAQ